MEHRHGPLGMLVQILPQAVFQKGILHGGGGLRHADAVAEIADGDGAGRLSNGCGARPGPTSW